MQWGAERILLCLTPIGIDMTYTSKSSLSDSIIELSKNFASMRNISA